MSFMKHQTYVGRYYSVETSNGTDFLPEDVCGTIDGLDVIGDTLTRDESDEDDPEFEHAAAQLHDYTDGADGIDSIELCEGTLYRMSAPGYLDCTDWSPEPDEDCDCDECTEGHELDCDCDGCHARKDADPDWHVFQVIKRFNGFELKHIPSGKTAWLGDGVDALESWNPGNPEFPRAWADEFNSNVTETMEAYFPELLTDEDAANDESCCCDRCGAICIDGNGEIIKNWSDETGAPVCEDCLLKISLNIWKQPTTAKDCAHNASQDVTKERTLNAEYGRGVIVGMVSAVLAMRGGEFKDALRAVKAIAPKDIEMACIPTCWCEDWNSI